MIVVAVSRLTLPAIDPNLESISRPLESVATIALVLPVSVAVHICGNRLHWLALASPRPKVQDEVTWLAAIYLLQWPGLALLLWSAPEVPATHLLLVHAFLMASALSAYRAANTVAGATMPLTLVAGFSVPDLIPWQLNIFYNLDESLLLSISTLSAVFILALVTVRLHERP